MRTLRTFVIICYTNLYKMLRSKNLLRLRGIAKQYSADLDWSIYQNISFPLHFLIVHSHWANCRSLFLNPDTSLRNLNSTSLVHHNRWYIGWSESCSLHIPSRVFYKFGLFCLANKYENKIRNFTDCNSGRSEVFTKFNKVDLQCDSSLTEFSSIFSF